MSRFPRSPNTSDDQNDERSHDDDMRIYSAALNWYTGKDV